MACFIFAFQDLENLIPWLSHLHHVLAFKMHIQMLKMTLSSLLTKISFSYIKLKTFGIYHVLFPIWYWLSPDPMDYINSFLPNSDLYSLSVHYPLWLHVFIVYCMVGLIFAKDIFCWSIFLKFVVFYPKLKILVFTHQLPKNYVWY